MAKKKSKIKTENDKNIEEQYQNEEQIQQESIEEIKKYKVKINKVEDNAVIVTLAGYSKRIYFDLPFRQLESLRGNKQAYTNKIIDIFYIGDISDIFNVRILPLKSIEDIGNVR